MDGMEGEMESQKSGTPDGMDEGVVEAEDETASFVIRKDKLFE